MTLSSSDLAEFVVKGKVDRATREAAADAITDTLAVMLAGSIAPAARRLAYSQPGYTGPDAVRSFRRGVQLRPDDAALLFGMAAHILDFDDVSMLSICHPSAPVLSALLAAVPWSLITGDDLCTALAVGTEVMIRLGEAIGPRHYALGFHSTATLGVFGAAAAVARLQGASIEETSRTFAIAASLASGLQINFGSMVKSLHVGIAAANAIRAAGWSRSGVSASDRDLLGPRGILHTFSAGERTTWPSGIVLGEPFALIKPGFERKRYACCYLLHKVIAVGIAIANDGIRIESIGRIRVEVPRGTLGPLIHPRPRTGMEALFSGPYAILAAIADREVSLSTFSDAAVNRVEIETRINDVEFIEFENSADGADELCKAAVRAELRLLSGETKVFVRTAAPGSADDPLTEAELAGKWWTCLSRCNPHISEPRATTLFEHRRVLRSNTSITHWLHDLWHETSQHPELTLEKDDATAVL
jgi:2-methylcitrate dehydratase PrpD